MNTLNNKTVTNTNYLSNGIGVTARLSVAVRIINVGNWKK